MAASSAAAACAELTAPVIVYPRPAPSVNPASTQKSGSSRASLRAPAHACGAPGNVFVAVSGAVVAAWFGSDMIVPRWSIEALPLSCANYRWPVEWCTADLRLKRG